MAILIILAQKKWVKIIGLITVVGSNPAPATIKKKGRSVAYWSAFFCFPGGGFADGMLLWKGPPPQATGAFDPGPLQLFPPPFPACPFSAYPARRYSRYLAGRGVPSNA